MHVVELAHFAPNQSLSEPCAELAAELYSDPDTEANLAGGGAVGDGVGGVRQPLAICSTCLLKSAHWPHRTRHTD